ncbi:MAG: type II toxin-antitoxin system RelE/ParE family toxin [bacterium]
MKVLFKSSKLQKICESEKELCRKYGKQQAGEIVKRINELVAAESLYDISKLPQARLHKLAGNYKNHFAVDIKHPYRLILLPSNGGDFVNLKLITIVEIIKIEDYH